MYMYIGSQLLSVHIKKIPEVSLQGQKYDDFTTTAMAVPVMEFQTRGHLDSLLP